MYNKFNQIFASVLFIILLPVIIIVSLFLFINIGRPIFLNREDQDLKAKHFTYINLEQ